MRTASLRPGTVVECDVRGRLFSARVTGELRDRTIPILPTVRNVSYRQVRAHQVKRVLSSVTASTQLQLEPTR